MAMNDEVKKSRAARLPIFVPFYYGWFIVALSFLANFSPAGIRSAPSALIPHLEADLGWRPPARVVAGGGRLGFFDLICVFRGAQHPRGCGSRAVSFVL